MNGLFPPNSKVTRLRLVLADPARIRWPTWMYNHDSSYSDKL